VLVVGVNGVGKTTTIGKLARRFVQQKRDVLLAGGDTFRAAAVAQLQEWGSRLGVPVCAQAQGADSAGVIFDALQMAVAHGTDVLIADTAGRLHTRSGVMDELAKVKRELGKLDADAPHEVLMVIDGTTGQNAINQVRQFIGSVGVTGLVVTKLDGTAKGGVVFALAREFALPIRYVGLGERAEDLRVFEARAFVDGLLPAGG
jgi:fused signal recognition particle receptor